MEENPLWEFDEDGMIREMTPELPPLVDHEQSPATKAASRIQRMRIGSQADSEDIEAQVRQEHEEAGPILEVVFIRCPESG